MNFDKKKLKWKYHLSMFILKSVYIMFIRIISFYVDYFYAIISNYNKKEINLLAETNHATTEPDNDNEFLEFGRLDHLKSDRYLNNFKLLKKLLFKEFNDYCSKYLQCKTLRILNDSIIYKVLSIFIYTIMSIIFIRSFITLLNNEDELSTCFKFKKQFFFIFCNIFILNLPQNLYFVNIVNYLITKSLVSFKIIFMTIHNGNDYNESNSLCFVAVKNGEIIGFVTIIDTDAKNWHLLSVFIEEKCRRLYIGRYLISAALFHIKLKSKNRMITTSIDKIQNEAIQLVQNLNFKIINETSLTTTLFSNIFLSSKYNFELNLNKFN
jgi:hypothetical protein